jgi:hypothetical protein
MERVSNFISAHTEDNFINAHTEDSELLLHRSYGRKEQWVAIRRDVVSVALPLAEATEQTSPVHFWVYIKTPSWRILDRLEFTRAA